MRNFEMPGRSVVMGMNGAVATSHPLATLAAIDVLKSGGNAIDAAVSACAVQCVVEPQSTGIGGDCFVLLAPKGGRMIAFNGSGRAPRAAVAEWFLDHGICRIDERTPHAVTIPGAVDAWCRLVADHGSRDLSQLLNPAIAYARNGFPVLPRTAFDWQASADHLRHDSVTARAYLRDGRAPVAGEVHRLPGLAATLERIGREGRSGFYAGPVAEDIVTRLRTAGGLHTLEDFAQARGEYVDPIATTYRGYQVYECPPNGQGLAVLEMLNILAGFALAALDPLSAERLHLEIEAKRQAYADRDALIADPAHVDVPVARLLSREHADEMRRRIDPRRRATRLDAAVVPAHPDTVYLCVVDRDLNAVSFINSLFRAFGSGITAPRSGVLLQNRGCGFVVVPGHPNCIAPGKRPLHTIIPGMLAKDGRTVMPFGVMGGHYQAMGHAHLLVNVLDHGMDVQEAIDCPRVYAPQEGSVEVESGIPTAAAEGLRARGHDTRPPTKPIGGGQAIRIDWEKGVLSAGSDPRKDGCALAY